MRVDLALLADYAAVSRDEKLTIAGIFDSLRVPTLPFVHPSMTLVIRLKVSSGEEKDRHFTIRGLDPDGQEFMPALEGEVGFREIDFLDGASANLILALNILQFEKSGRHRFDIAVDGRYEETVGFDVVLPEA